LLHLFGRCDGLGFLPLGLVEQETAEM
jgi:hypothetical protein